MEAVSGQEAGRRARGGWREFHLPAGRDLGTAGRERGRQDHHASHASDDPGTHGRNGAAVRARYCGAPRKSARELRISVNGNGTVSTTDSSGNGGIFRKAKWAGLSDFKQTHRRNL